MSKYIRTFLCILMLAAMAAPLVHADDDDIYDHVNQKLNADRDIHGRITIAVKNGVVTLTGYVHDDKIKERATKLTKKVAGVKDVINKIELGEAGTPKP